MKHIRSLSLSLLLLLSLVVQGASRLIGRIGSDES